ncbi:hypothetical protein B296_00030569 [Ensete ventricosum]|uniref:Uncharacterized protein n=1 Tax=Ensete ventricosum TaxID=4639 RepID=A0A426XXP1_ENSVE|nr:hypothetical protein B296_00030569 [Ensete ventricosum]
MRFGVGGRGGNIRDRGGGSSNLGLDDCNDLLLAAEQQEVEVDGCNLGLQVATAVRGGRDSGGMDKQRDAKNVALIPDDRNPKVSIEDKRSL